MVYRFSRLSDNNGPASVDDLIFCSNNFHHKEKKTPQFYLNESKKNQIPLICHFSQKKPGANRKAPGLTVRLNDWAEYNPQSKPVPEPGTCIFYFSVYILSDIAEKYF